MKLRLLSLIVFALCSSLYPQEKDITHEMNSNIEELSGFHDIIYPIWHTAYPEKDYKALREYKNEVNLKGEKLLQVTELPGILRERQAKWQEGLKTFRKTVDNYNAAADGNDDQALLDAAEKLHSNFEMLVRIIRPVLREVDDFHQLLYVVYHKDLPDKEFKDISQKSSEFVTKAEAITKATLSKRLESRTEKFRTASAELLAAAKELQKICQTENNEGIESAVNKMHSKYQQLEAVFE